MELEERGEHVREYKSSKEGKYVSKVSEAQNLARKDHRGDFRLSGRGLSANSEQVYSVSPY